MSFVPHITVATIIEHQARYLMVEEVSNNRIVFNQPAGHLDPDESLIEAAARETLEETGWTVEITGLTGLYLFQGENGVTYQRTCFIGVPVTSEPERPLDQGIIKAHWLTLAEIESRRSSLRSPMVLECIYDYLNKPHYPLDLIR